MATKVPTRLEVQAKLHKTYESVTSKHAVVLPHEKRALNVKQHVRGHKTKNYVTSSEPRYL